MSIDVVVLPVAGLGTRFLPVTKAIPKEMLPIVDTPLIQLAVEEAARAGIREVVLVNSGSKRALEDHFDKAVELEAMLESRGKQDLLMKVRGALPEGMGVACVRQAEALGLGHAILCAKPAVGNRSFAVMLVDDLIDGPEEGCLSDMLALYRETGAYSIAVQEVPRDQTNRYGIVSLADKRITALVEKPAPAEAPSNLAVVGRYVLPPEIFAALAQVRPGVGGEIQLTDGIAGLLTAHEFHAHRFRGVRYDCGSKLGHLQANLAYAFKDPVLAADLKSWLASQHPADC